MVELAGGSMEPTLRRGWRLLVEPLSRLPWVGEIIALRGRERLIVHRVVHVARLRSGLRVYHTGDASGALGRCSRDAIVGRVTLVLDREGRTTEPKPMIARVRRRLLLARWRSRVEALVRSVGARPTSRLSRARGRAAGQSRARH